MTFAESRSLGAPELLPLDDGASEADLEYTERASTEPPAECEQLVGESTAAAAAFRVYRDAGAERSIRKVARTLHKSSTLMGRWSARHAWVERCLAWDRWQDRITMAASFQAVQTAAYERALERERHYGRTPQGVQA